MEEKNNLSGTQFEPQPKANTDQTTSNTQPVRTNLFQSLSSTQRLMKDHGIENK